MPSAPGAPTAAGVRASVALSYATFVVVGLAIGAGGVLLAAQIDDYGVDRVTIGLTFFTGGAGFTISGLAAGPLLHLLGTRTTLLAGAAAGVLSGLVLGAGPPFAVLVAVQFLVGAGAGLVESVLNVHLAALLGADARLGRLHGFFGVGALAGPALAALMLQTVPWTVVWLLLGLLWLPLGVGFAVVFPPVAPPEHEPMGDGARPPASGGLLLTTLRQPAVLLGSTFLALYVGLEIGLGNWAFSYLVDEQDHSEVLAGYVVSGYWFGLTLGRFTIGPVAARLGRGPAATTSACLVGVGAVAGLMWLAPVAAVTVAGFAVVGYLLGPVFPSTMAVVPGLTEPRLVPTAIGIVNGVSSLGGAALPWVAGALFQAAGGWTLMPFAVVLAVVQLALWRLTTRSGRRPS